MEECCICLDNIDIDNNKIVYIINDNDHCENNCKCNIKLHSGCFFEWYKKNMTCPICRQNINNENLYFNTEDDFKELDKIKKEYNQENTIPLPSDQIINTLFNEIENIRENNSQLRWVDIEENLNNRNQHRNTGRNRNRNRSRNRRNAIIPESDFRNIHDFDNPIIQNNNNENNNDENNNRDNPRQNRRGLYSFFMNMFR